MCDITAKQRKKRYKKLRKAGHTVAWARRARDFSEPHYTYHVTHNEFKDIPITINTISTIISANDSNVIIGDEHMKEIRENDGTLVITDKDAPAGMGITQSYDSEDDDEDEE